MLKQSRFLLVLFQIEYICQQTSTREMLHASRTLPSEAASIYTQTLEQIDAQSKSQSQLARKILCWLVLAKETLKLEELLDAIAIEPSAPSLDPLSRRSPAVLIKVCRGLVVVDNESTIRLAHLTVQEFLLANLPELRSMEREIAVACVTYISFESFLEGPSQSDEIFMKRQDDFPFYKYACYNLPKHILDIELDENLLQILLLFIFNISATQSYVQMVFSQSGYFHSLFPTMIYPLHVATFLGRTPLVDRLVMDHSVEINANDSNSRTPLLWAIEYSSVDMVCTLLKHGANVSTKHESALNCAARLRRDDIVRVLLESSMNVVADQPFAEFDLMVAAITGDADVVLKLLQSGVKPDITDIDGGTALQWASWYGHADIVRLLLANGADVEARDQNGRRAIHEACERGNLTVIILLLAADTDIEAKDRFGFTALHRAAMSNDAGAAHMLLDRGADMMAEITPEFSDSTLKPGQTPFHLAIGNGNLEVAKLLISRGFDLSRFTLGQVSFFKRIDERTSREIYQVVNKAYMKQATRTHKESTSE